MSESYPVRRAAQLTAYVFHRGKDLKDDGIAKVRDAEMIHRIRQETRASGKRASNFTNTFKKELHEGFKNIDNKMKKDG